MDFESFLKNYVQKAGKELEKEAMSVITVEFNGYLFSKDILTMLIVALVALEDPRVDSVLKSFGLELKDLKGRKVFPRE
mgnify:CR=1 FL=1